MSGLSADRLYDLYEDEGLTARAIADDLDLAVDTVEDALQETDWYEPRPDTTAPHHDPGPLDDGAPIPDGGHPVPPITDDGEVDLERAATLHHKTAGPITLVCNGGRPGRVRFEVDAVDAPVVALEYTAEELTDCWGASLFESPRHAALADRHNLRDEGIATDGGHSATDDDDPPGPDRFRAPADDHPDWTVAVNERGSVGVVNLAQEDADPPSRRLGRFAVGSLRDWLDAIDVVVPDGHPYVDVYAAARPDGPDDGWELVAIPPLGTLDGVNGDHGALVLSTTDPGRGVPAPAEVRPPADPTADGVGDPDA